MQTIWAKDHPRSNPGPLSDSPGKGDGKRAQSGCGHTLGVGPPPLAPLGHSFEGRYLDSMQSLWSLFFMPNISSTPTYNPI